MWRKCRRIPPAAAQGVYANASTQRMLRQTDSLLICCRLSVAGREAGDVRTKTGAGSQITALPYRAGGGIVNGDPLA